MTQATDLANAALAGSRLWGATLAELTAEPAFLILLRHGG